MWGRIRSCAARIFSRSSATANVRRLLLGRLALVYERREKVDWHWKKRGRVMFARNLAHRLQKAQLQRDRFLAHHGGGLHHFFRPLKFALGVDDLGAA